MPDKGKAAGRAGLSAKETGSVGGLLMKKRKELAEERQAKKEKKKIATETKKGISKKTLFSEYPENAMIKGTLPKEKEKEK